MHRKAIHLFHIVAVGLALMLGAPLANAQDPQSPGGWSSGWVKGKKQGVGGAYSLPGLAINGLILSKDGDEDEDKDADGEIGE